MSKKSRSGRPLHDFWLRGNFEQITIKSRTAALCQFCLRSLRNTSKFRLLQHRKNCKGTSNILVYDSNETKNDADINDSIDLDDEIKSEKFLVESDNLRTDTNLHSDDQASSSSLSNAIRLKKIIELEDESFISELEDKKGKKQREKDNIDKALAMFFFGCDIPLSVVESSVFQSFVKTLKPSYKPPTRNALSRMLLDKTLDLLKDMDEEPSENN